MGEIWSVGYWLEGVMGASGPGFMLGEVRECIGLATADGSAWIEREVAAADCPIRVEEGFAVHAERDFLKGWSLGDRWRIDVAVETGITLGSCARSSVDRASACGAGGRRFESSRARQFFNFNNHIIRE